MFFTALTTHCQSCLAGAIAPISEGAFFFYLLNSAIASYLWWQLAHNNMTPVQCQLLQERNALYCHLQQIREMSTESGIVERNESKIQPMEESKTLAEKRLIKTVNLRPESPFMRYRPMKRVQLWQDKTIMRNWVTVVMTMNL